MEARMVEEAGMAVERSAMSVIIVERRKGSMIKSLWKISRIAANFCYLFPIMLLLSTATAPMNKRRDRRSGQMRRMKTLRRCCGKGVSCGRLHVALGDQNPLFNGG
jgi:hypothetical protein